MIGSYLVDFLNHSSGREPCSRDIWNIMGKITESWQANAYNILGCKPSSPIAVPQSNFISNSFTLAGVIITVSDIVLSYNWLGQGFCVEELS